MPILSADITDDGPFVSVRVGLSRPEVRRRRAASMPIPEVVQLLALIDSGAQCSCFDPPSLNALSLPLRGISFATAPALRGMSLAAQHDASLTIVHPAGDESNLVISDLPLTELPLGELGYQLLIGRDILERCFFAYNGPDRNFIMSY